MTSLASAVGVLLRWRHTRVILVDGPTRSSRDVLLVVDTDATASSLESPYGSALLSVLEKAMLEKRPVVVEVTSANGMDQVTGITIKAE